MRSMSEMSLLQRLEFLTEKAKQAVDRTSHIFYILVITNTSFPNNFPLFSHFLHKKCLHLKNIV